MPTIYSLSAGVVDFLESQGLKVFHLLQSGYRSAEYIVSLRTPALSLSWHIAFPYPGRLFHLVRLAEWVQNASLHSSLKLLYVVFARFLYVWWLLHVLPYWRVFSLCLFGLWLSQFGRRHLSFFSQLISTFFELISMESCPAKWWSPLVLYVTSLASCYWFTVFGRIQIEVFGVMDNFP